MNAGAPDPAVQRAEWVAGVAITLAAVALHVAYWRHAGGLWRDETNTVHMAALPALADLWSMLSRESAPLLPFLTVRAWAALGFGDSDLALRGLGLVIGLLLLASLWIAARSLRGGAPVVSLALVALNVTVIRFGDSLRGYGLASALAVLVLALVWRFVQQPSARRAALAALAAVASVQALYQSAFFVLAGACGAGAVCARERRWRDAAAVVAIGGAAALSLLPYVPVIARAQDVYVLARSGFDAAHVWRQAAAAMASPIAGFSFVWALLVALALAAGIARVRAPLALYATVALTAALAGFAAFLAIAGMPTQPWYYIPALAFAAACLDALLPVTRWARAALVALAMLCGASAAALGWPAMHCRQTNLDLAAEHLGREAATNDLILVQPFYAGTTFARYYRGAAPWTTLPPLADYSVQRHDLFKVEMQREDPIRPVLDRIAQTLRSGHQVWLVGPIPFPRNSPPEVRPAPNNPWGWLDEGYSQIWAAQAGYFVATHATGADEVPALTRACVNPLEDLRIARVSGWQERR